MADCVRYACSDLFTTYRNKNYCAICAKFHINNSKTKRQTDGDIHCKLLAYINKTSARIYRQTVIKTFN